MPRCCPTALQATGLAEQARQQPGHGALEKAVLLPGVRRRRAGEGRRQVRVLPGGHDLCEIGSQPALPLGGIIAQRIALRHPDRVLSVTSMAGVPSDVSGLGVGRYVRFGMLAKLARAKVPEGRDGDIQLSLTLARAVASRVYPFDEHAAREWIEREADSGPRDTEAQSRQAGAAWHGPKLRNLRKPVLVLHGDQDPLLRVSAARATARAIKGARLVILPGAGHDLPAPLWPMIADEIRQLADQAEGR
jgi:pimeloyl-ACP methyl ester carboxylesterase